MFLSKLTQTDFMMASGTTVFKWDLCLTGIQPRTPEEAGPPLVPPSLHRWCCSHHNIHHTDSRLFHTCDRCTLLTSSQLWIEKGPSADLTLCYTGITSQFLWPKQTYNKKHSARANLHYGSSLSLSIFTFKRTVLYIVFFLFLFYFYFCGYSAFVTFISLFTQFI